MTEAGAQTDLLIAGGGIGGLAAALALTRQGASVHLLEQAQVFTEVGAGIQLGPNVVRVLQGWGLQSALQAVAAWPQQLQARSALTGEILACLPLGAEMAQRYGAPYATVHRADLHSLLLAALQSEGLASLQLQSVVQSFEQGPRGVRVSCVDAPSAALSFSAQALIGADGLWSRVRTLLLNDAPPRATGHLAYRVLVPQKILPHALRCQEVRVWMGEHMHGVQYPVCGGDWLNLVVLTESHPPADAQGWDLPRSPDEVALDLRKALRGSCSALQDLVRYMEGWRVWPLCERGIVQGAHHMAQGHVALLGDAAHPMLPYLAQGAGMAIEDAQVLASAWSERSLAVPQRLQHYARQRWQRNARVQQRAQRNGQIFHSTGVMRVGRDLALRSLGARLMDIPWLYGAQLSAGKP